MPPYYDVVLRPSETSSQRPRGGIGRWLAPVIGYSISIACLVWVYRGFNWQEELPRLRATDWTWVAIAVVADIAVYICQGYRWSVLLRPVVEIPPWRSIQSIYIGLFANEVLPLRPGEVIRAYLLSRWAGTPLSVMLSSAALERLLDGWWLLLSFVAISQLSEVPKALEIGSWFLIVVLIAGAVIMAAAILHKERTHGVVRRNRLGEVVHHVVEGLHVMGRSRSFPVAIAVSLLYLIMQVVPVYALIRGYDLPLGVTDAVLVLLILRMGTVLPLAPGNVGSFQALTIAGLMLCGVDRAVATGFATLLFVVVTVPLWLTGFIALIATGMRLGEIRHRAHSAQPHAATRD